MTYLFTTSTLNCIYIDANLVFIMECLMFLGIFQSSKVGQNMSLILA